MASRDPIALQTSSTFSRVAFVATVLSAIASVASAQSITEIPDLYGFGLREPHLSGNGLVVVGRDNSSNSFRWTAMTGTVLLSALSDSTVENTNFDGSFIVGSSGNYAYRWTAVGGKQSLIAPGGYGSRGFAISGDGSVVTGYGYSAALSGTYAFRWTSETGMQFVGNQPIYPLGISRDGATIAGYTVVGPTKAIRWTATEGVANLGTLPEKTSSTATAVNADGGIIIGESSNNSASGSQMAFRWTSQGGMQSVANAPSTAYSVSDDGALVVGDWNNKAFLWEHSLGTVELATYLSTRCINLAGWNLTGARGISGDGRSFCGIGSHNGKSVVWVANLLRFDQQPQSANSCSAEGASFSVLASGTSVDLRWQWRNQGEVPWRDIAEGTNYNALNATPMFTANGAGAATVVLKAIPGVLGTGNLHCELRAIAQNSCDSVQSKVVSWSSCSTDLSCDGQTDDADFVLFAAAYNMLACDDPAMPVGCPSDFNRDGVVDDADFVIFAGAYNALLCQ